MNNQKKEEHLLSPFRALDLTDEKGFLCGKILGDLGVDVIKIERPGGDPSRNIGPFYHDIPDPEKSLYWFAYNSNKRGITLDIETSDGQKIFKKLVKTADFVVESFHPGYLDKLGLGYSNISKSNPRIIMVSITPFGQTGPYKDYKASDIVAEAMSGFMFLTGDPDRPPVRISFPQAFHHAGAEAAVGAIMAHYYRQKNGEGQHVDISLQSSICPALLNAPLFWDLNKIKLRRAGASRVGLFTATFTAGTRNVWPCKDGYVSFQLFGGNLGGNSNKALIDWMDSEAMAPEYLKQVNWSAFDFVYYIKEKPEELERYAEAIADFFKTHTKAELFDEALKRRVLLYPVNTMKDIVEDIQLTDRGFWEKVEHPELGVNLDYPGAFVKCSESSCGIRYRAPLIGEHNSDVYTNDLGYSSEQLGLFKERGII